MTSRFVNLFKRSDLDEQRAFQRRVHGSLSELYPDCIFILTEDPLTLKSDDDTVFGLTNLRSNFLLSTQSNHDLQELIRAQFDPLFTRSEILSDESVPWAEAMQRLMPQLMPSAFLDRMDLVSFPFGDCVVIGFVIDSEEAYSYVREEELVNWGVNANEILSQALTNLNERSHGIEITAFPEDNGMFVINTMDGFDAVRIIDPKLKELIAEHIGSPFYVGIPNRDFLICWSPQGDDDFQNNMRSQVAKDHEGRPYPLSGKIFEVSSDGEIAVIESSSDPRALSAENN